MKPGDLIVLHDEKYGVVRHWRVEGVYFGCQGQEGLVELRNLTEKPGVPGRTGGMETTFVPFPIAAMMPLYSRVDF